MPPTSRALTLSTLILICPTAIAHAKGAENSPPPPASDICQVVADAANYDGKEVVVRGFWRAQIHGSILMGTSCPKVDVNLRETSDYKANKQAEKVARSATKKNRFQPVEVVVRGTFRSAHQLECLGEICARYEVEITELIWASPPSKN
jgi:diphthamide synthase (EF-2-diphthine--ammonia ligase)